MDTIITAFGLAFFTVAGLLFLFHKVLGWHGIAQHKAKVDIAISVIAFFLFAGTSTMGIFVAAISGFLASVVTSMLGKFLGSAKGRSIVPVREGQEQFQTPREMMDNAARTANAMRKIHVMLQDPRDGASRH